MPKLLTKKRDRKEYQRQYYLDNMERLLKYRADKYKFDPEYREDRKKSAKQTKQGGKPCQEPRKRIVITKVKCPKCGLIFVLQ